MPWKKEENENMFAYDKGCPVWVNPVGEEKPFDYQTHMDEFNRVIKESVDRKKDINDLKSKLIPFEGIESPVEWRKDKDNKG